MPWGIDLKYKLADWRGYSDMDIVGHMLEMGADKTRLHLFRHKHLDGAWSDHQYRKEHVVFATRHESCIFRGVVLGPLGFGRYHVMVIDVLDPMELLNCYRRLFLVPGKWYCRCGHHNDEIADLASRWTWWGRGSVNVK